MAGAGTARRSSSERYLVGVAVVGAVALVAAAVVAGPALLEPTTLLFTGAFALTAPTPLVNHRRGDTATVTVEEVFLVPAFVLLPAPAVVVAVTIGMGLGLLLGARWRAPWVRGHFFVPRRVVFNVATGALAAGTAAVVVQLIAPGGGAGIGAAAVGAVVFAVMSLVLVAGIIARVSERRTADVVRDELGTFLLTAPVVVATGALLALAVAELPVPPAWVGLAVLLVVVASALTNRALQQSERVTALLASAAAISAAGADMVRLTAALEGSARNLLDCREATLTTTTPGPSDLAVELVPGTWLHVAVPRTSYARSFEADAPPLLEALGTIATPALERALAMTDLRSADELKAAVLASVSHDIRTPLAIAAGTAELLVDHPELATDQRLHLIDNLRNSIDRISSMVEGLLDLERYELGRLPEPADADVAAAVARVVSATRPEAPSPLVVRGDPVRARIDAPALERVVDNLVSNALKHGPAGEPVVIAFARRGNAVRLTVDDAGPGVEPERRLEVFEPFRHGGRPGAVGLGLWVARRFVELREGRIWVDESDRGGAAFHVELPPATPLATGRSGPAVG